MAVFWRSVAAVRRAEKETRGTFRVKEFRPYGAGRSFRDSDSQL